MEAEEGGLGEGGTAARHLRLCDDASASDERGSLLACLLSVERRMRGKKMDAVSCGLGSGQPVPVLL